MKQDCPRCNTVRDTTCCACGCGNCLTCGYFFCCTPIDFNSGIEIKNLFPSGWNPKVESFLPSLKSIYEGLGIPYEPEYYI